MTRPPELADLIDADGSPEERARLERMHELLVAAGPPPDGEMPEPIRASATVIPFGPRRLRVVGLAAVAAAVLLALGGGYLLGTRGDGFGSTARVAMHGVAPTAGATVDLDIGREDTSGNVPIEMHVHGLPASRPRAGTSSTSRRTGGSAPPAARSRRRATRPPCV